MAYEYLICGAGIAGLYCALNLIEKNSVDPKSILILEKSYRIGGLIKTNNNDKFKIAIYLPLFLEGVISASTVAASLK